MDGEGKKLIRGLRTRWYHSHVAYRSCEDCVKFMYNEDGEQVKRPARVGLPVLRPKNTSPPCYSCPKIPDDAPIKHRKYAVDLSEQNEQAYEYYLECKAVNEFPHDPIVRRWAGLIRRLEDAYERNVFKGSLDSLPASLAAILLAGVSRGR